MRSEKLDKRIVIEKLTISIDGYGQRTRVWTVLASCWANVKLNIGNEMVSSKSTVTYRVIDVKIRYRTDLNYNMRIIYNNEYYNIDDLIELGREDGIMIKASRLWQT